MQKPSQPRLSRLILTALVCIGLILAACTRSANPDNLPTATIPGATGVVIEGQDATMAAIGTEVSAQLTQTAVAASGAGGGDTPIAPTATAPAVGEATPIPPEPTAEVIVPTDTSPPPVDQPTAAPPVVGGSCPNPYTVKQGDWIFKIARDCNVAPSALIAANPGINPNYIVPGQVLNMPAAGATAVPGTSGPTCTGTYTVVTGDNLFRLAYNCGLTTEQLAAANGIPFPYTIYPGQVIRYP